MQMPADFAAPAAAAAVAGASKAVEVEKQFRSMLQSLCKKMHQLSQLAAESAESILRARAYEFDETKDLFDKKRYVVVQLHFSDIPRLH